MDALIGRERERGAIDDAVATAAAGRGRLVLVSGEPGIGKSRLLDAAATSADERGLGVVWGRCWEGGGALPYWPWIQVLRALRGTLGPEADLPELARILPELGAGDAPPDSQPAGHARFLLFDAVARYLLAACARRPTLIVLEDLHGADVPSLELLALAAPQLRGAGALVLGTFRSVEAPMEPEVAAALAKVSRMAELVELSPLGLDGVAELARATPGVRLDDKDVARLHHVTGGNPLFVTQLLSSLVARGGALGAELAVPETVRAAIRERLAALPPALAELLPIAASVGDELEGATLAGAACRPVTEVMDLLTQAVRLGFLVERSNGHYAFSHALFAETLRADLPAVKRMGTHHRIARALEEQHVTTGSATAPWTAIAHHWLLAGPEHVRTAVERARLAAERASRQLAFHDAARLLEQATRALAEALPGETTLRYEGLTELGRACILAGEPQRGKDACLAAAELARSLDEPERLAHAALILGGMLTPGRTDPALVKLLEEALAVLPKEDSPSRAKLLGRLGAALQPAEDPRVPVAIALEGLDIARRLDEPTVVLEVLDSAIAAVISHGASEVRRALCTEAVALAKEVGTPWQRLRAQQRMLVVASGSGDRALYDRAGAELERLAGDFRQPHVRYLVPLFRASQRLLDGDLAGHTACVQEVGRVCAGVDDMLATTSHVAHAIVRGLYTDDRTELEDALRQVTENFGGYRSVILKATCAGLSARLGREASARRWLAQVPVSAADTLFPFDMSVLLLVEATAALRDRAHAEPLLAGLSRFADEWMVSGAFGLLTFMPVAWAQLRLAAVLDRHDEARASFETARRAVEAMRAHGVLPRLLQDWGEVLIDRGAPAQWPEARAVLEEARQRAREMGMPLVERIDDTLARLAACEASVGTPASSEEVGGPAPAVAEVQAAQMSSLAALVAGIAHEINTPLGALQSTADTASRASELLREVLADEELAGILAKNRRLRSALKALQGAHGVTPDATARIGAVVTRLRSFARLDQAEVGMLDLHEALDEVLALLSHQTTDRVEVVRRYGEVPPIHCKPLLVNQLLMGLLTNAVQAIEERGVVTVETEATGDALEVRIRDTGTGIAPEHCARIFAPGFTTKGVGVGLGLGLSVAQRIAREHRGAITFTSEVGAGSTFVVRLPLDPGPGTP